MLLGIQHSIGGSHSAFWRISGHHSWVGITSQTCPLIPPHLNLNERKIESVRISCLIGWLPLKFEKQLKMHRNPPRMNSLKIQHQAFGQATDLAIANVRVKLHQEKEKQDGITPELSQTTGLIIANVQVDEYQQYNQHAPLVQNVRTEQDLH